MAKRKSNRQARALLCVSAPGPEDCFRISNRRWQVYGSNYPHAWQHVKSSRSQRRADKKLSMNFDDFCGVIYSECM